jgi:hypothetical protein
MFNHHRLLGFKTLNSIQYNQRVATQTLTSEVQAKISTTKLGDPAK